MKKSDLTLKNLNDENLTILEERNWKLSQETIDKSRFDQYYCGRENGFKFLIKDEQITIWNGNERIYIPYAALKLKDYKEDVFENVSEFYKDRFLLLSEKMPFLNLNANSLLDLCLPYLISTGYDKNILSLYMEGDFNDEGNLKNLMVANFIKMTLNENKKTAIAYYDYYELDNINNENLNDIIEKINKSGKDLFSKNCIR